jgi:hypothetical protein
MTVVEKMSDPYAKFREPKSDDDYHPNHYGVHNASVVQKQNYNKDLISQDQYGQEYDVSNPNIVGFAELLKKTKRAGSSTQTLFRPSESWPKSE